VIEQDITFASLVQRLAYTLVQLQTDIPAIIEYMLGPTWRKQLSELGMICMPQSKWTNDDETAVALCVLRGGSALMDTDSVVCKSLENRTPFSKLRLRIAQR
jgi:hypothetical protein